MSGLAKELLLDYALLSTEEKIDMELAIEALVKQNVFSITDVYVLDLYIEGYTEEEIARRLHMPVEHTHALLVRMLRAIEYASGYTDHAFVHSEHTQTLTNRQKDKLYQFLQAYGMIFSIHAPKGMTHA